MEVERPCNENEQAFKQLSFDWEHSRTWAEQSEDGEHNYIHVKRPDDSEVILDIPTEQKQEIEEQYA